MSPAGAPSSLRRTIVNLLFAVVGGALLVLTVQRVGWMEVQHSISSIGWWYVLILVLGGVRFAVRARAWQVCAGPAALPFRLALRAGLAGDALGNLTPLGLLASEPAKVFLVNDRVSTVAAVSSVAAENAFYIGSVMAMIGAGALVFFNLANLPPALSAVAQLVLALVMIGAIVAVWIARRQPAILSRAAHTAANWSGRGRTAPDRLREIEVHFYAVLRWPATRIAHVSLWEAVFHVAAVAEVLLVLRLLPDGARVTLLDAFVLETAGRLIVVLFKFVPYRLGVDEAGSALVTSALALDPALGVALALVRRIRVLSWNGVGLLLLATASYSRHSRDTTIHETHEDQKI